jgi:hypothetical protein
MAQTATTPQETSGATPGVRIPIALPVRVLFRSASGEPLDGEVRRGHTRDVNATGLGLEVANIPAALAATLSAAQPSTVVLDIDVPMARTTLRVSGRCTWLRVLERHGHPQCVAGIEYAADSKVAQQMLTLARGRERRLARWKMAAAFMAFVSVAAGVAYWRWYAGHMGTLEAVSRQLEDSRAAELRGTSALAQTSGVLDALRTTLSDRDAGAARLEQEIDDLQDEIVQLKIQLADVDRALMTVSLTAPTGLDTTAVYHLERARLFWDRNQEAASLVEYDRAIHLEPTLAEAYLGLAEANEYFGRLEPAAEAYRRFLSLRPGGDDAAEVRLSLAEIESTLRAGTTPKR